MSKPTFGEEQKLWKKGYHVIGVDEVGRGAFAGPLVASAVVFPQFFPQNDLAQVRDSKALSSQVRETLAPLIDRYAIATATSEVSVRVINKIGIGKANQVAFRKAIAKIQRKLSGVRLFLLVDGFHAKYARGIGLKNQKAIIRGDSLSLSIASASIIAKVYRDNKMSTLTSKYSCYRFEQHKGYGTKLHRDRIRQFGVSPMHRLAFCALVL